MNAQELIEKMKSSDPYVRYEAWKSAGPMGAEAVAGLADLVASSDRWVARAAKFALGNITHYAARPASPSSGREGAKNEASAVAGELLKVATSNRPLRVRADALNLLGFVGDGKTVSAIAKLLDERDVRDEARMALERIPGRDSQRALQRACERAPADFKPNIEQSLRSRSLTPVTAGLATGK